MTKKVAKYKKLYYKRNKNRIKKYCLKNRNKILQRAKDYWKKNKNKIKQYRKKRFLKIRKYIRIYIRLKRNIDTNYMLMNRLRSRIWDVLKRNSKSETTMKLIGCDIKFLREHLQKQFKLGMTWDNYGKWHIDHIRPCSKFDLSKISEQKKCFNYKNLQPLWAKDNLSKGVN